MSVTVASVKRSSNCRLREASLELRELLRHPAFLQGGEVGRAESGLRVTRLHEASHQPLGPPESLLLASQPVEHRGGEGEVGRAVDEGQSLSPERHLAAPELMLLPRGHPVRPVFGVPVEVQRLPVQDVPVPDGFDVAARRVRVHLPHQLVVGEVPLQLVGLALSHQPVAQRVVAVVPAPVQQPSGMLKVVERVAERPDGGLAVAGIAGDAAQAVQSPEQRLLRRQVAEHPLLALPLPDGRPERVHVQPVHDERGRLRAEGVPPVLQHQVREGPHRVQKALGLLLFGTDGRDGRDQRHRCQHHFSQTGPSFRGARRAVAAASQRQGGSIRRAPQNTSQ